MALHALIPSLRLHRCGLVARALTAAACLAGLAAVLAAPHAVQAQTFPSKPIHIIVPYNPGGAVDAVARKLATGLATRLGQPVLVDNKPGGNTLVATKFVAAAKPDGHTLYLTSTAAFSLLPALYRNPLGYNADKDFTPISLLVDLQSAWVVHPSRNLRSMPAYIAYAKENPGKLTFGTTGTGQIFTLTTELIKSRLAMDVLQVPFQGGAPAVQALVGGQIDSTLIDVGQVAPFIKGGQLVPLAVMGSKRSASLPDTPTFEEAGLGAAVKGIPPAWLGLVGPAGIAPAIVARLNAEINLEMQGPEMASLMNTWSQTLFIGTPELMAARIKEDIAEWGAVIRKLGVQLD